MKPLSTVKADVISSYGILEDFTEPRLRCLQVFLRNMRLVEWLRQSVTGLIFSLN